MILQVFLKPSSLQHSRPDACRMLSLPFISRTSVVQGHHGVRYVQSRSHQNKQRTSQKYPGPTAPGERQPNPFLKLLRVLVWPGLKHFPVNFWERHITGLTWICVNYLHVNPHCNKGFHNIVHELAKTFFVRINYKRYMQAAQRLNLLHSPLPITKNFASFISHKLRPDNFPSLLYPEKKLLQRICKANPQARQTRRIPRFCSRIPRKKKKRFLWILCLCHH